MVGKVDHVFFMIKRKSTTCCLDINETASVLELKKMVGGIMKKDVEDIKLLKDQQNLKDDNNLKDYEFKKEDTVAHAPATLGLVFRNDDGKFEDLEISELSTPPELPEVMRKDNSTKIATE